VPAGREGQAPPLNAHASVDNIGGRIAERAGLTNGHNSVAQGIWFVTVGTAGRALAMNSDPWQTRSIPLSRDGVEAPLDAIQAVPLGVT
jgi:hypothetical protein